MSLKRERAKLLKAIEEKKAKLEKQGDLPVTVTKINIPRNIPQEELFKLPKQLTAPTVLEKRRLAKKAKRGNFFALFYVFIR